MPVSVLRSDVGGLFSPVVLVSVLVSLLLLGGCANAPLPSSIERLPERVELSGVPFFAQRSYQGAPGALAMALMQQGVVTTPGLIAEQLQLPEQQAHIEQRLHTIVQGHGLLVYPLTAGLPEMLAQVTAGFPVLLRYNQGVGWLSAPRYAVLVGYDRAEQSLLLRSGLQRRESIDFADFQSAWRSAGQWAVLVQAPAQLPAEVNRARWLTATTALEDAGQTLAASNAARTLGRQNPDPATAP